MQIKKNIKYGASYIFNKKKKRAIEEASKILKSLNVRQKISENEEKLIELLREHLKFIWPRLQRLRIAARHVLEIENEINKLNERLKNMPIYEKVAMIRKANILFYKLRQKNRHEESFCLELAEETSNRIMQLKELIEKIENLEGIGKKIAKQIAKELKEQTKDIHQVFDVWGIEIKKANF